MLRCAGLQLEQLEGNKPAPPSPAKSTLLSPGSSLFDSISPTSMSAEEFAKRQPWPGGDTEEDALPHRLLGKPSHTLPPLDTSSRRSFGSVRRDPFPDDLQGQSPKRLLAAITEAGRSDSTAAASSPQSTDARGELSQEDRQTLVAAASVKVAAPRGIPQPLATGKSSVAEPEDDVVSEHSEPREEHTEVDEQQGRGNTNEEVGEDDDQHTNDNEEDDDGNTKAPHSPQLHENDDISEAFTDPPGVQASRIGPSTRLEVTNTDLHFDRASDIEEIPDIDEIYEVESSVEGDGGEETTLASPTLSWHKPATADDDHTGVETDHSPIAESPKLSARDRLRLRLQQFQEAKTKSPKAHDSPSVELSNSWDESFDDS